MNVLRFFTLYSIILVVSSDHPAEESLSEALIVHKEAMRLDQMEQGDENRQCNNCLTACPASESAEDELRLDHLDSLTANSLFLRKFYEKQVSAKEMELRCPKSFKPSMIYDDDEKSYNIGYELYYVKGTTTLLSRDYRNLRKVTGNKVDENKPVSSGLFKRTIDWYGKTTFTKRNEKNPRTLVFSWVPVLSVQIDKHQRHIALSSDVINGYKTMDKCEEFIIGDGWVQNQVKKIVAKSSPPKLTREHSESSCHLDETCLEKTQIVPMSFLHTNRAKMATCAHVNLALIWEKIAKGQLAKVDRYLYAVLRRWYSSVSIIFGVSGEFKLEEDELLPKQSEEVVREESVEDPSKKKIPLENPLEKIPLPKIIYRIVQYFLEAKNRRFEVLIVIHNNRDDVKDEDRICPKDSEVSGWDRIKSGEGVNIGLSYACPVTKETIEKLGKYGAPTDEIPPPGILKLNRFPEVTNVWFFGSGTIFETADETQNVAMMYDAIFSKIQSKL